MNFKHLLNCLFYKATLVEQEAPYIKTKSSVRFLKKYLHRTKKQPHEDKLSMDHSYGRQSEENSVHIEHDCIPFSM